VKKPSKRLLITNTRVVARILDRVGVPYHHIESGGRNKSATVIIDHSKCPMTSVEWAIAEADRPRFWGFVILNLEMTTGEHATQVGFDVWAVSRWEQFCANWLGITPKQLQS